MTPVQQPVRSQQQWPGIQEKCPLCGTGDLFSRFSRSLTAARRAVRNSIIMRDDFRLSRHRRVGHVIVPVILGSRCLCPPRGFSSLYGFR